MPKTHNDIDIIPPHGSTSCGFNSVHETRSCVSVSATGVGVEIWVERDEENIVPPARLTLEEGWQLYIALCSMFYKTREAEAKWYEQKYGKPSPNIDQ